MDGKKKTYINNAKNIENKCIFIFETENEEFEYLTNPPTDNSRMNFLLGVEPDKNFVQIGNRTSEWWFDHKRGHGWKQLVKTVPGVWCDPSCLKVMFDIYTKKLTDTKIKKRQKMMQERKKEGGDATLSKEDEEEIERFAEEKSIDDYTYSLFLRLIGGRQGLRRVVSIYHKERKRLNAGLDVESAKTEKKKYIKTFLQKNVGSRTLCLLDPNEEYKYTKEEIWHQSVSPIVKALEGDKHIFGLVRNFEK